jgi:hypothetical protein
MPSCAVKGCRSSSYMQRQSFHHFPGDPNLYAEWARRAGIDEYDLTRSRYICRQHFVEGDYELIWRGKEPSVLYWETNYSSNRGDDGMQSPLRQAPLQQSPLRKVRGKADTSRRRGPVYGVIASAGGCQTK